MDSVVILTDIQKVRRGVCELCCSCSCMRSHMTGTIKPGLEMTSPFASALFMNSQAIEELAMMSMTSSSSSSSHSEQVFIISFKMSSLLFDSQTKPPQCYCISKCLTHNILIIKLLNHLGKLVIKTPV